MGSGVQSVDPTISARTLGLTGEQHPECQWNKNKTEIAFLVARIHVSG
jgi:hypothetical protein